MFKRRKFEDSTPGDFAIAIAKADTSTATAPAVSGDTGLGVPPFRPAPLKETAMSRPPFPAGPTPVGGPSPGPGAPSPATLARPGIPPQPAPRASSREAGERRMLVVGRGISLQGTVQDAERLVVEGTIEASMIHATELSISQGGMFKGEVEVEDAEVAGTFNGTLTARGNLVVRATGRVLGQARCRRLQVEDGGQLSGQMEMLTDNAARTELPVRAAEAAE